MIIKIAEYKNLKAIDLMIATLVEVAEDDLIETILAETAQYLEKTNPKLCKWFKTEIEQLFYGEEVTTPQTIEDLKHILIDSNFKEGEDFIIKEGLITMNDEALILINSNYGLESIEELLSPNP
jgi:hypothetical protein